MKKTILGEEEEAEEFFQGGHGLDRRPRPHSQAARASTSASTFRPLPIIWGGWGRRRTSTFPWVVSDFGLTDAIESGLVKIPQLAVRDTTGARDSRLLQYLALDFAQAHPGGEAAVSKASPKPEAILKWANTPIAMLAGSVGGDAARNGQQATRRSPPAGVHPGLQEYQDRQDGL